jgi:hypothetical protein
VLLGEILQESKQLLPKNRKADHNYGGY